MSVHFIFLQPECKDMTLYPWAIDRSDIWSKFFFLFLNYLKTNTVVYDEMQHAMRMSAISTDLIREI